MTWETVIGLETHVELATKTGADLMVLRCDDAAGLCSRTAHQLLKAFDFMLAHKQHRLSSLLQIEVLRPGNISPAFALAHLLLNINEEGHAAGILRLPAAGTGSVFALELTAVFSISGNHCSQLFLGISFAQRAEADEVFLIRPLQCRLLSWLVLITILLQKMNQLLE